MKVSGTGLHTGELVHVDLEPAAPNSGVRWFINQETTPFLDRGLSAKHLLRAERTTVIVLQQNVLRTPEHLAAALLLWPEADLDIRVHDGELPIGDGSAMPWLHGLEAVLGEPAALEFYPCNLRTSHSFGHGFYETSPMADEVFEADISLEREGFQLRTRIRIESRANLSEILAARTFIFEADYTMARNQGWLKGAQESSGILLRVGTHGLEILNGGPLRHPMEPLLHKVLDLVGDLALIRPQLPRLSVRIHNGGHAAHHHLIDRIQKQCP